MRTIFLLCFVFLFNLSHQVVAQSPQGINYQGVARSMDGQPLTSKEISIRISILNGSANGEMEYDEIHEVRTNSFGLFTLVIGQGESGSSLFNFINWTSGKKWLQIELDENGGRNFKLMGSQQLMSVPYALYAERSGNGYQAGNGIAINNNMISNLGDGDQDSSNELITDFTLGADNKLRITDAGGVKEADLSSLGGTSQNLSNVLSQGNSAGNTTITNLGAPVSASDAATKVYVDNLVTSDEDKSATNEAQTISKSGSNVTLTQVNGAGGGTFSINDADADATNELQNLNQVLTRGSDAGGNRITNLSNPTSLQDATTRNYVDVADAALAARISNTYAFKVNYNHTHSVPSTQVVTVQSEDFDGFSVITGNRFIAPENGVYQFTVSGVSLLGGIAMQIRKTPVAGPVQYTEVKRELGYPLSSVINYFESTILQLNTGDVIELVVSSSLVGETVSGTFYGFKL